MFSLVGSVLSYSLGARFYTRKLLVYQHVFFDFFQDHVTLLLFLDKILFRSANQVDFNRRGHLFSLEGAELTRSVGYSGDGLPEAHKTRILDEPRVQIEWSVI